MKDRTQPPNWPSPRGPWPEVSDTSRLFDHGKPWCANTHAHPEPNDGYPDVDRHVPWNECRTLTSYFDGAHQDLHGPPVDLELYAAAVYQFGALRTDAATTETRIVLEVYADRPGEEPIRVSLPLGEALRLSRRITRLIDQVSIP